MPCCYVARVFIRTFYDTCSDLVHIGNANFIKLLEADDVVAEAIRNVEQNGIVFIDEIDKICTPAAEVYNLGVHKMNHDASDFVNSISLAFDT